MYDCRSSRGMGPVPSDRRRRNFFSLEASHRLSSHKLPRRRRRSPVHLHRRCIHCGHYSLRRGVQNNTVTAPSLGASCRFDRSAPHQKRRAPSRCPESRRERGRKRAYRRLLPSFTGRHGPGRLELLDPPAGGTTRSPRTRPPARTRNTSRPSGRRRSSCWAFVGVFLRELLGCSRSRATSVRVTTRGIATRGIAMCWSFLTSGAEGCRCGGVWRQRRSAARSSAGTARCVAACTTAAQARLNALTCRLACF